MGVSRRRSLRPMREGYKYLDESECVSVTVHPFFLTPAQKGGKKRTLQLTCRVETQYQCNINTYIQSV